MPNRFCSSRCAARRRFPALLSGSVDASSLTPRDISQFGSTRGHAIADLSKEIQLVWNGVAVSNKLLAENPGLVERYLRAIAKGREFARRY